MLEDKAPTPVLLAVQISEELRAQTAAADLIRVFVTGATLCSRAKHIRLIHRDGELLVVQGEAFRRGKQIRFRGVRPLKDSEAQLGAVFNTVGQAHDAVLTSGRFHEVSSSHEWCLNKDRLADLLCFPLQSDSHNAGILFVKGEVGAAPFDQTLIGCLRLLSAQAAVALENIRYRLQTSSAPPQQEVAAEALRESERALAEAQRISKTGNWRWNLITDCVTASPECRRIYGVSQSTNLTRTPFLSAVHPDDLPQVEIDVASSIAHGRVLKHEYRLLLPSGEIRNVLVEGHPQPDEQGAMHYIGVVSDVTERTQFQQNLQTAQAKLSNALRLATIGEFAAAIIHEIAQPLTGIVTNTETCLRWMAKQPADIDRAQTAARRALRDAERAIGVSRGLRSLVSKSGISKAPVDIDDTIEEVSLLLSGELERENIRLSLHKAAERPVSGDRFQLQQVLMNLMCNAIDAMRSAKHRTRRLMISSESLDADNVQITVHDTGEGFLNDPEQLFDPLFTTKPGGMGMGLRICRSIVDGHGGKLTATSSTAGTTFRCTLPYIPRPDNS
ncbi:Two-component oxygen-sensor histidine kinase FixL [Paraburkholderia caribensis MBA4]|uniref:histidine kinase n=1 Tax=Paraburkholderia caribensis MBA4 TaxID=1323664 RepID=A0A0P0RHM4_9BURK|nr:ATP-binding protein [Paraburkholderia caribensis]ALL68292.1 Two-component oxygen-sensor histidine kinase FixL [Paraburkholderia caribensis MBA4]